MNQEKERVREIQGEMERYIYRERERETERYKDIGKEGGRNRPRQKQGEG